MTCTSTRWLSPLILLLAAAAPATVGAQVDERVFYASVIDKDGAPAPSLTEKDFVIREDGQSREILRVSHDTDPLQIALLVDNSEAMENSLADLRKAASAFIDGTRGGVPIALITLADRPTIAVPYTTDHAALKKGVDRMFSIAGSGDYLLDGIAEASQGLSKRTMWRPVIAVIAAPADLSYRQYPEVLEALQDSGATLHVITLGSGTGGHDREIVVSKDTNDTGGRNDVVLTSMGMPQRAQALATEISNQYRIVFARPQRLIPPKNTEISVKSANLRARGALAKTDKERK